VSEWAGDEAEKWLAEHDSTWTEPKEARDVPYGGMLDSDSFVGSSDDDESAESKYEHLELLARYVNEKDPNRWIASDTIYRQYHQAHKEQRNAYDREWRARARANPVRGDRRYYAGQFRTESEIEQFRAESLVRYHANRDAINAARRAKRAAKRKHK
jgi:hypothetical protein